MLKGEVFGRQLFENQIFALFINTFLNGNNGVCSDYLNGMAVTYSGNNVTIDSGAVCIQGRFLEEDTSTTLDAGNSNLFCKLVIEIDLDKVNTDDSFNQGYYKIVTDSSAYPELTQTDIVGTNSGVYQYELARFKTSTSGITDFQDMRTSLSIPTIYDDIRQMVQDAIDSIEDGSAFVTKLQYQGTTLYDNPTGSSTSITLSESVENFDFIEIYYAGEQGGIYHYNYNKIDNPNNKQISLLVAISGLNNFYLVTARSLISGANITLENNRRVWFYHDSNAIFDNAATLYITKVVGYKY